MSISDMDGALEALDALALASGACSELLARVDVWNMGLRAFNMPPCRFGAETLVRATCFAEARFRDHGASKMGSATSRISTTLLPRNGGWAVRLVDALDPLGLACTTTTEELSNCADEDDQPLPPVPYVVVLCDAADEAVRPTTEDFGGRAMLRTYPCPHVGVHAFGCMNPAAFGCVHCAKHGAAGARQAVARVAAQMALSPSAPRRVVFAARSQEVLAAYRRAMASITKASGRSAQQRRLAPRPSPPMTRRASREVGPGADW